MRFFYFFLKQHFYLLISGYGAAHDHTSSISWGNVQSHALTGPFQPGSYALFPVCSGICVSIPPFPDRIVTFLAAHRHTRVRWFWFTLSLHSLLFFFYKYVNKTKTAYGVAVCFFLNMCLFFHSDMCRAEECLMRPGGGGGCVAA